MENKYYVPDLTEFRVGFRFEFYSYVDKTYTTKDWIKVSLPLCNNCPDGSLEYYNSVLQEENLIRCKYLDEEDILELGFVKNKEVKCWFDSPIKNDKYTRIYYSLFLFPTISIDRVYVIKNGIETQQLFRGQVKNYNELEVILKQIGI